jgi:hypothetical protein
MADPNFERVRTMLLRTGEPDRVPLGDISVHPMLKAGVLGRPVATPEDEVAFWAAAGFDYVPIEQGLQLTDVIKRQSMHEVEAHYAVGTEAAQVRSWATEGTGLITTVAELEAFRWPDPDTFDYGPFDRIGSLLPAGMKVVGVLGKIFSCVWWLMGLEGMSLALADEPELVPRLFHKVGQIQRRALQRMLDYPCVGAIWQPANPPPTPVPLVRGDEPNGAREGRRGRLPQRRRPSGGRGGYHRLRLRWVEPHRAAGHGYHRDQAAVREADLPHRQHRSGLHADARHAGRGPG